MAAAHTRDYETLYGVGLLDDLHNYFPAVLYEPESFRTLPQLLGYIQRQTQRRFDLFTFGQTAYDGRRPQPRPSLSTQSSVPLNSTVSTPQVSVSYPPPLVRQVILTEEEDDDEAEFQGVANLLRGNMTHSLNNTNNTLTLLSALLSLPTTVNNRLPANFMNPVVVRPTEEQIESATTVQTLTADLSENCAICQDSFRAGEQQRTITHCGHSFHSGEDRCIDVWFRQNVYCPVCRHDIRERE
jgi:hypothetical protein